MRTQANLAFTKDFLLAGRLMLEIGEQSQIVCVNETGEILMPGSVSSAVYLSIQSKSYCPFMLYTLLIY